MTLPDHLTYLHTRHFGSLDGLRFLCIGAVIWHHSPLWETMGSKILSRGFTGVDFFFVISGFLITTLLLRERAATGRISLRGFYWRRFLRIVPIYFLVITAVGAYYIFAKGERQYLEIWPYYYLFLSNYLTQHIPTLSITWSLSVEEQYYILWPLLVVLVPLRAMPAVLVGLIALNLAAVTGALRPLGIVPVQAGPLVLQMFAATFTPILMGSGAALMLHSRRGFALLAPLLGHRAAPLILLTLVIVLLSVLPGDLVGWPNMILHGTMTLALISTVIREDNVLRPVLAWGPIARIGQISYGIYLYHLIALHVIANILGITGWAQLFLYAALAIVMAEISFRTYEAWFQRLRRKSVGSVGSAPETA